MKGDKETDEDWLLAVLVVLGTALILNLLADIFLNVFVGVSGVIGLLLQYFTVTLIAAVGLAYIWKGSVYLRRVLQDIWPRIVLNPSRELEPNSGIWSNIFKELLSHAHLGYRRYSFDEIQTGLRNTGVLIAWVFILQSLTLTFLYVLNGTGQLKGLVPVITETRGLLIGFIAIFSPLIGSFALGLSIVSGSGAQEVILFILILPFSVILTPAAGNIISIFESLNSAFVHGVIRLSKDRESSGDPSRIYLMLLALYIIVGILSII